MKATLAEQPHLGVKMWRMFIDRPSPGYKSLHRQTSTHYRDFATRDVAVIEARRLREQRIWYRCEIFYKEPKRRM